MQYKRLQPVPPKKDNHWGMKFGVGLALVLVGVGLFWLSHRGQVKTVVKTLGTSSHLSLQPSTNTSTTPPPDACAAQTASQVILVSISKQHLWACAGRKSVYNAAVITGMELYPADLTPTGTYHIYAKAVNQTLAGHDSTGSWSDFVNYWMPFLDNKYGTYGFHDLTQAANGANGRADSDFGNVDINAPYTAAKHASHGCVETPLVAMKWIYNWASVGTAVTVES